MKHDYTSALQINSSLDERIIAGESELKRMSEINFTREIDLLKKLGVLVPSVGSSVSVEFHFIKNPDGSIRWIWEAGCKTPEFLSFYHAGTAKSRIFKMLAKLVFAVKLGSFFKHGAFTTSGWKINRELNFKALFTGTTGPNRKAIAKVVVNGKTIFLKYAESDEAVANLKNEDFALRELADSSCSEFFNFPEVFETSNESLFAQSELPLGNLRTALKPADLNLAAFLKWQKYSMSPVQPHFSESPISEGRFSTQLIQQLAMLSDWCRSNFIEKSCWNHGDFTPWNCKVKDDKLFIFDWEMFTRKGIPLADLFHFIYQQAILVDKVDYMEIRSRIDEMFALPVMQEFLIENDLNPVALERHYLNQVVNYYLGVYSRQEKWHTQVHWLLSTWSQAISYHNALENEDLRSEVLDCFQLKVPDFNLAFLKYKSGDLKEVPETSDFDICTIISEAGKILDFFRSDSRVESVKVRDLYKMHQIEISLLNGSRIYLDLIFKFRRKHIDFLNASEVLLSRTKLSNGIWVASREANEKYITGFYSLNNSEIPAKYLMEFVVEDNRNTTREIMLRSRNRGVRKLRNRLEYIFEILKSMKSDKGFLVTFSGVDGAGKSTIIENVRLELEKKHRRRVVVIRHRPSILPIISAWRYGKNNAEQRSASTLPRQGENSSKLSSLLRFAYYLTDYVFGQWIIHFRYVRKGVIVLYDRYYFDFINDSKRSNIKLNAQFTSRFYFLIKKPRYNYFLWAPADVILKRKQELNRETIDTLTSEYIALFERLQNADKSVLYRCIKNIEIGETVAGIMRNIMCKPHEKNLYQTRTLPQSGLQSA